MTTDDTDGLARNSVTLGEATFVSIATMAPGVGAAFAVIAGAGFAGGGRCLPRSYSPCWVAFSSPSPSASWPNG